MLDQDTRQAILRLAAEGHSARAIGKALHASRNTVRRVLRDGQARVPIPERPESALPHVERIRELYLNCQGNLVRVREELEVEGIHLGYSTLTGFCRRHGIGVEPKQPAGHYEFSPGQEMQHDTSPHDVVVAGKSRRLQCASVVLCHSRMLFAQVYPRFIRFWCKVFLTEALRYFQGAARDCMVDNTNVVVAHGCGRNAVIAPEMAAFAERFGFVFKAHAVGDANRSAHVERRFHYIENNFYPGRTFSSLQDVNLQLREWCAKVNGTPRRHLGHVRPIDLFQAERTALSGLPVHVPEVYCLHDRIVDLEGYVTVHGNRYSAPIDRIGRCLEIRETPDQIRLFDGHHLLCEHIRHDDGAHHRSTLPEHRQHERWKLQEPSQPVGEEALLRATVPELNPLIDALKKYHGGRAARPIRILHRLWRDYPRDSLIRCATKALAHGLLDLARIEHMVLRDISGNFFLLPEAALEPNPSADDDPNPRESNHE